MELDNYFRVLFALDNHNAVDYANPLGTSNINEIQKFDLNISKLFCAKI